MTPPSQHCITLFYDRLMDFTAAVSSHVSEWKSVSNDKAGRTVGKEWTSKNCPTSFHARRAFLFPNLTNHKRRTDLKGVESLVSFKKKVWPFNFTPNQRKSHQSRIGKGVFFFLLFCFRHYSSCKLCWPVIEHIRVDIIVYIYCI